MKSIWSQTCEIKKRKPLNQNQTVEIAVIGAGMAGILAAYELQKAGKQVIILEANHIASGQTRNTTAKITSQHGILYHKLIKNNGKEKALQYAMANENAIREYQEIIKSEHISCNFEKTCSYVYSKDQKLLEEEANAAKTLHLPASYCSEISVPVPAAGAVKFEQQAQFHPLKFIKSLSEQLTIFEQTPVKEVKDHLLITEHGTIEADKIIFACHYPFVNFPGLYFTRMHQERSYVLALEHAPFIDGMYIGNEEPSYSFRKYENLLLFGGENHRTGKNSEGGRYQALLQKAQELFPDCHVKTRWSAQDCITSDHIPFIGQYSVSKPNWYVTTGFKKWGMTTSLASAFILRDLICGNINPYADVFRPERFSTEELPSIVCDGGQAVKGLSKRIFQIPEETARELPIGHGGIVSLNHEKVGVYKESEDKLHVVDIRCPHLGCQLEWNPDELSWDCPCHGSRFDFHGNLISNPAKEGISLE